MNVKSIILIVSGLAFVALSGCHHQRFSHFHGKGDPEKKANYIVKKISKELKLDDKQKAELNRIKDEILARKDQFQTERDEMHALFLTQLKSTMLNQDVLNNAFEEKESHFKETRIFLIAKLAEFHSILTPEQRIKLTDHIQKIQENTNR